jgi:carbon storage regulator
MVEQPLKEDQLMLVLTRKLGEKIHIGRDITVSIVEINGTKIRLGIEAPEEVRIFRSELVEFMDRVGAEATPNHDVVAGAPA